MFVDWVSGNETVDDFDVCLVGVVDNCSIVIGLVDVDDVADVVEVVGIFVGVMFRRKASMAVVTGSFWRQLVLLLLLVGAGLGVGLVSGCVFGFDGGVRPYALLIKAEKFLSSLTSRGSSCDSGHSFPLLQNPFVWKLMQNGMLLYLGASLTRLFETKQSLKFLSEGIIQSGLVRLFCTVVALSRLVVVVGRSLGLGWFFAG